MNAYFNSQALIIARESRGRSQTEVGSAAGITQGLISKAEADLFVPNEAQLERIAKFLEYPVEFFSEPGQLRDGASVCHYHRKRKTLPAKILSRANAMMFVRNVNVQRMLNGLEIAGARQFHTLEVEEFGTPTAIARALRTAWRIPDGPISNLIGLIESASGIVILSPFGNRKLFGMSCWATRHHPLFYMNSEISMADLRWTLAHEIGHLTMHAAPTAADPETEADEFAAEFLMPSAQIAADLKALRFESLGPYKLHWRVSMKTLIRRAESLGCIGRDDATRLYKRYSAHGFNASEPYEIPRETPTLLARAAEVHLGEHGYSVSELRRAIRLTNPDDYAEVTTMPPSRGPLSVVRS
ncbi:MAG: XRE family transcriptional regulator [Actinomycetota bacterium]|nr:XRE family transcriptional regulator [Actinomycetota bacterium]